MTGLTETINTKARLLLCLRAFEKDIAEGHITMVQDNQLVEHKMSDAEIQNSLEHYKAEIERCNIQPFLDELTSRLHELEQVPDTFLESIKAMIDPETNNDVNQFVDKCVMLRLFCCKSLGYTISKEEFISLMISIELEDRYINLLNKYFPSELSSRDIIQTFL
jgi:hypothetical protein